MSERVVSDKGERERVEREVGTLRAREKAIEEWFREERRWKGKYRNYSARDVACLRGTVTEQLLAHHTSEKLYTLLRRAQAEGGFSHTFGCLDTVMASNQALAGLTSIYISGWQCSSTHTSNNEFGPDFADYPADTVPSKVQQIARSLVLRDRIQNEERARLEPAQLQVAGPPTDYLLPIVADADAGFGGVTSVMKLTKMFIEAGAAAIHLEDQRPSMEWNRIGRQLQGRECRQLDGGEFASQMEDACNRRRPMDRYAEHRTVLCRRSERLPRRRG